MCPVFAFGLVKSRPFLTYLKTFFTCFHNSKFFPLNLPIDLNYFSTTNLLYYFTKRKPVLKYYVCIKTYSQTACYTF